MANSLVAAHGRIVLVLFLALLLISTIACSDTQEITVTIDDRATAKPVLHGVEVVVSTKALGLRTTGRTDVSGMWIGEVPCFSDAHPELEHKVRMLYQGQEWEQAFTTNEDNCRVKRSVIFMYVKQNRSPVL